MIRARYLLQKWLSRNDNPNYGKEIYPANIGNEIISKIILGGKPAMISRFGSVELSVVYHYNKFKYKKEVFWNKDIAKNITELAGVFPGEEELLKRFSKLYLACSKDIDLLGVWFKPGESTITKKYCKSALLTRLEGLEPYYFTNPWSRHLHDKKVLVIHPFKESIEFQYERHRTSLFADKEILPTFTLNTIKAIQSHACNETGFVDWFAALDSMCRQIDSIDFDIAIIGAGAYGLPLASYVKRKGKIAIHLGGATQILFGIKGRRWDSLEMVSSLYNEYWKRPDESESPKNASIVEDGCYW